MDDASTDGTRELAAGYAARDARVTIVRNERNRGLVGNWNHCAAIARGEWIKFVFQDDLLAPSCVERLLAAARGGCPLVSCARDFIFEPGVHPESRASFTDQEGERRADLRGAWRAHGCAVLRRRARRRRSEPPRGADSRAVAPHGVRALRPLQPRPNHVLRRRILGARRASTRARCTSRRTWRRFACTRPPRVTPTPAITTSEPTRSTSCSCGTRWRSTRRTTRSARPRRGVLLGSTSSRRTGKRRTGRCGGRAGTRARAIRCRSRTCRRSRGDTRV